MMSTTNYISYIELNQSYRNVRKYCIKALRYNNKSLNISFWEKLQSGCEDIYNQARQLYLKQVENEVILRKKADYLYHQGKCLVVVNELLKKNEDEKKRLEEYALVFNEAYCSGYMLRDGEKYGLDFFADGEERKFLPWKEDRNPYADLQKGHLKVKRKAHSLQEIRNFFFDLMDVLEKNEPNNNYLKICGLLQKYEMNIDL